ncbi:MAG: phosphonate metabolim protein, transferase hexapeptide repeat family [Haloquadratum walsbyi J07HQW1]|jgi:phosphonate metabolism protein (transferase hexapeptide repeat family)|uniref:Phosphonate metabolim protein, transferase hexapeptide repeat family n=1 Tax=Haloquadratum walsbyi J07HQW1 TaxID=1238424 RepID=U1PFQ0_9EURY|nr:MAG: phosphonate metabolim protein, transferase hexapeptide repeat family [Haloquadratum walsbyi J07HQW1]
MYIESYGPIRIDSLSPEPTLHDPVYITESELGRWTDVRSQTRISESTVDDYSYLMERVQLDYASVGKFVSVASDARLGPTNHPITRPTAHHFSYRAAMYDLGTDDETVFEWRADHPVTIGHDVWIGHGATILPGVEIGNGAVIGAGSVVTDDVSPYTVVAGVPAEFIRRRFAPEIAVRIESTEWWHWDHETLSERIPAFRDLELFLDMYAPAD